MQDGSSGDSTWTAGRPFLGVFVAHILLGVKLRADSKRDVEALSTATQSSTPFRAVVCP